MSQFSSVLVGNESLLIQCGELLRQRGHTISAVITQSPAIRDWAAGAGLRVEMQDREVAARLDGLAFDWLFSIANLSVIPDVLLERAAKGAINFHDGPLPRYAGLNAPVWAILKRETAHGITWHMMEGGIDEGDIVEARSIEISETETALTLNTKCYAAAMDSFSAVIDGIEAGGPARTRQDLSQRSYFGRNDRPRAGSRLDFRRPAAELNALVRGLWHGAYWNPLACPKVEIDGQLFLVGHAETLDRPGGQTPGSVLEVDDASLIVATATAPIRLGKLTDLDGAAAMPSVSVGTVLPSLDRDTADRITDALAAAVKYEPFWRRQLIKMERAELAEAARAAQAARPEMRQLACPDGLAEDRLIAAIGVWAARSAGHVVVDLAYCGPQTAALADAAPGYLSAWVPLAVDSGSDFGAVVDTLRLAVSNADGKGTFATDLGARDPGIASTTCPDIALTRDIAPSLVPGSVVTVAVTGSQVTFVHDAARLDADAADRLAGRLETLLAAVADASSDTRDCGDLPFLSGAERQRVLHEWNATDVEYVPRCVHHLIEDSADRTPGAVAAVFEGVTLTYGELDERANRVAHALIAHGVGPDTVVGLYMPRSLDLIIGALGILKAGGAYLPLDPAYPEDRIHMYLGDSGAPVVLTVDAIADQLPPETPSILAIDRDPQVLNAPSSRPSVDVRPDHLAYLIFTSGSTGRPKGVMVEHRNVANFFVGMDDRIPHDPPGVWLAVTSLSFDISVLELFYTLARGFKIVLSSDENRALVSDGRLSITDRGIDFSLFYWGNDDGVGPKKYELLLEGAKFADKHGFNAVWTPERHFHAFGGPYPNPSVTGAAVAAVTSTLEVRAGSCVAPLHHPARIAEEWAVIDNLTNGRTGLAIASGWQPDDFVLRPENTPPENKKAMFEDIEILRRLWRGESVGFPRKDGSMHEVVTQPRPVSRELGIWVTTAGNPETWKQAGEIGANVLTHLLGQSIDEVGDKIRIYHDALRASGRNPADHKVTLMLHTYLGADRDRVREEAKGPMMDYLRSAAGLIKQYAWAFPAFKKPQGVSNPFELDLGSLDSTEMEAILEFAFDRYFEESGLFGTVQDALARVEQVKRIGVDEVACLIDYGIAPDKVLAALEPLAETLAAANRPTQIADDDFSIAAQILRHGVTHLQCTPSMARMIAMNEEARFALGKVKTLMLGGEALPGALVDEFRGFTSAHIENMYGPTETTIWSSTGEAEGGMGTADIGRPIANTQLYVLDAKEQPVPVGVPGELYIGGDGVTRGYWARPDLTEERFRPDPFVTEAAAAPGGARMYRTGDLVRWKADGRIDFLGRADSQVKIRGYRIELGEIESVLAAEAGVREAAVLAREDVPGDVRLVAYVTTASPTIDLDGVRNGVATHLPEHMVPQQILRLEAMPLTPNGKIDRKALPSPSEAAQPRRAEAFVAPTNDVEKTIADVWKKVLGLKDVGSRDNFFDLGGHSLLAVQAHRELKSALGTQRLSITDIFRFPTLDTLARHLDGGTGGGVAATVDPVVTEEELKARAETMSARRAMRARRRTDA